jgi:hypothetical protein
MPNEQKIPLSRTLPRYIDEKIRAWMARCGKAMPGYVKSVSGAIVTINFDVSGLLLPSVQMPVFGPEYIRYPIQAGDKGVCFPADYSLAGVNGLGTYATGVVNTTRPGNLSALVWFPVGSAKWSSVDPNAVTIYGPGGVVLRDTTNAASIDVDPTSGITMSFGGHTIVIGPSGVLIDGVPFLLHTHSGVTTGSGLSGPVST